MKNMIAVVVVLLLSSCAAAPTQKQIDSAYYGEFPEKYEEIVKDYMETRLKDPASATYKWGSKPIKMWAGGGLGGAVEYGWGVCPYVNAKNSFGGYVGAKRYFFLLRDNQVVKAEDSELFTEKLCVVKSPI